MGPALLLQLLCAGVQQVRLDGRQPVRQKGQARGREGTAPSKSVCHTPPHVGSCLAGTRSVKKEWSVLVRGPLDLPSCRTPERCSRTSPRTIPWGLPAAHRPGRCPGVARCRFLFPPLTCTWVPPPPVLSQKLVREENKILFQKKAFSFGTAQKNFFDADGRFGQNVTGGMLRMIDGPWPRRRPIDPALCQPPN